jgi:hypothetical protein
MQITQLMVMGIAVIGCAVAVAVAACGAGAGYNPAAATNPSMNSALTLSQCMHSHGIKMSPDSPAFKQAVTACSGGTRRLG